MKNVTGKQLKKARLIKEMTQQETAKLLGVHRSYLSLIENGRAIPSDRLQRKINLYFGDTVKNFLFN